MRLAEAARADRTGVAALAPAQPGWEAAERDVADQDDRTLLGHEGRGMTLRAEPGRGSGLDIHLETEFALYQSFGRTLRPPSSARPVIVHFVARWSEFPAEM